MTDRKFIQQFGLFSAGAISGACIAFLSGPGTLVEAISLACAYASLIYVAAALFIGASHALNKGRTTLSIRQRRHFGIWAGIFGIWHVAFGIFVHFEGRIWPYFFTQSESGSGILLRIDAFGIANYVGLSAAIVIVFLLALSNDTSIKNLGPKKWKFRQRLAYPLLALVVLHGVAYQLIEGRSAAHITLVVGIVVAVLIQQCRGILRIRTLRAENSVSGSNDD